MYIDSERGKNERDWHAVKEIKIDSERDKDI